MWISACPPESLENPMDVPLPSSQSVHGDTVAVLLVSRQLFRSINVSQRFIHSRRSIAWPGRRIGPRDLRRVAACADGGFAGLDDASLALRADKLN